MKAETVGALICATVAALVYLNTLPANFAFDDNFAVVRNADVVRDDSPLWGLLEHDFWGQRISSAQSHKSFRPLTVLAFRLIRRSWDALPGGWRQAAADFRRRMLSAYPGAGSEGGEGAAAAGGAVDPLPFHAANL
ncbi:hypothetical protein Agub_g316, partial [Astrephomene gubernaculifera]